MRPRSSFAFLGHIALALFFFLPACSPNGGSTDNGPVTNEETALSDTDAAVVHDGGPAPAPALTLLTPEELHRQLESKDFRLINVHVPREGQIPGTDVHIPFTDIDALEAELGHDRDAKVVLYCRSDRMSGLAGQALVERGYRHVSDLEGGMIAWSSDGYPLEP